MMVHDGFSGRANLNYLVILLYAAVNQLLKHSIQLQEDQTDHPAIYRGEKLPDKLVYLVTTLPEH